MVYELYHFDLPLDELYQFVPFLGVKYALLVLVHTAVKEKDLQKH
jgi:hypothetical protein